MSLKTLHQIIIFAGVAISLVFAAYCFFDASTAGIAGYKFAGVGAIAAAAALVAYEIHFLKKTRRLVL